MTACYCGSSLSYAECCQPRHLGTALAPTAEKLMRSRYSAFAVGDGAYLVRTAHATDTAEALSKWAKSVLWLGLTIHGTEQGTEADTVGTVSFTAKYLEKSREVSLTEKSNFEKRDGAWIYLNGKLTVAEKKLNRNEPCPCGSGKKLKQCHG